MKHTGTTEVDIYPVGLLSDLKRFRGHWWCDGRRVAVRNLVRSFGRGWRRRSYWNGYLAEAGWSAATRAGHGWTKSRARLDLARHVSQVSRGRQ